MAFRMLFVNKEFVGISRIRSIFKSARDVLSTEDMVVQRRDGPRGLREHDDDDHLNMHNISITDT